MTFTGDSILGIFVIAMIGLLVASPLLLLYTIPKIIVSWILFAKAGQPGWAVLVPFYGLYVHYKIADAKGTFWATIFMSTICLIALCTLLFLHPELLTQPCHGRVAGRCHVDLTLENGGIWLIGFYVLLIVPLLILGLSIQQASLTVYKRYNLSVRGWMLIRYFPLLAIGLARRAEYSDHQTTIDPDAFKPDTVDPSELERLGLMNADGTLKNPDNPESTGSKQ